MNPWLGISITVMLSASGALVSYGILKGSLQAEIVSLRRDVTSLRQDIGVYVTRSEYESRHRDLQVSIDRVERKVDRLLTGRNAAE